MFVVGSTVLTAFCNEVMFSCQSVLLFLSAAFGRTTGLIVVDISRKIDFTNEMKPFMEHVNAPLFLAKVLANILYRKYISLFN